MVDDNDVATAGQTQRNPPNRLRPAARSNRTGQANLSYQDSAAIVSDALVLAVKTA